MNDCDYFLSQPRLENISLSIINYQPFLKNEKHQPFDDHFQKYKLCKASWWFFNQHWIFYILCPTWCVEPFGLHSSSSCLCSRVFKRILKTFHLKLETLQWVHNSATIATSVTTTTRTSSCDVLNAFTSTFKLSTIFMFDLWTTSTYDASNGFCL